MNKDCKGKSNRFDAYSLNLAVEGLFTQFGWSHLDYKWKGDSVWRNNDNHYLYLEHKTERESMTMDNWWSNENNTLEGLRPYIKNKYGGNCQIVKHQHKWMIILAQLCCAIKKMREKCVTVHAVMRSREGAGRPCK